MKNSVAGDNRSWRIDQISCFIWICIGSTRTVELTRRMSRTNNQVFTRHLRVMFKSSGTCVDDWTEHTCSTVIVIPIVPTLTRPAAFLTTSGGGKGDPRTWYGRRLICRAFGIPTWGCRQPCHAVMTRWCCTTFD